MTGTPFFMLKTGNLEKCAKFKRTKDLKQSNLYLKTLLRRFFDTDFIKYDDFINIEDDSRSGHLKTKNTL